MIDIGRDEPSNILRRRYLFYQRSQDANETFVEFLEAVRLLAKSCEFENIEESLIRDRIVFGIDSEVLRERFFSGRGNPSLNEVVDICCDENRVDSATVDDEIFDNSFHAPSECDESRKATDDNQLFVCSICSKQYTQKSNVLRHMLHTHVIDKSMECSKCAQSHQSMAALRDHLSRHISRISNTSVAANVCPVCDRKFRRKCNFDRHLNTHTSGESLICDVCMKKFTSPETLASHKRLHAEELRCVTCSKIFKSRYCYKAHMLIHRVSAASVQFECHRCKKVYLTLHQLKRHMRNHNRMVRGDCNICGHAFYNASDQKAHQRKHTGELPFECEYCHRRFRVKDNLKSHLIQHTGDRPFGCSLCGKCYARKSKLTQHIDTVHKKLKSFGCEICEKRFPTQSHLKQHVRSHSSVRPFQCTQCGVQFKKKSDLKVHLNRKHQLEDD